MQELLLGALVLGARELAVVTELDEPLKLLGCGGRWRRRHDAGLAAALARAPPAGMNRLRGGPGMGLRELLCGLANQDLGAEQRQQREHDDPGRLPGGRERVPDEDQRHQPRG